MTRRTRRSVAVAALLTLLFHCALVVAHGVGPCSLAPPVSRSGRFYFRGGGFHLSLVLEAQPWMDTIDADLVVENGLFFDLQELRHHFTVELVTASQEGKHEEEEEAVVDVSDAFAVTLLESEQDFDIEAPIFKIPYTAANVSLRLKNDLSPAQRAAVAEAGHAHLRVVLPIHARYTEAYVAPELREADGSFKSPSIAPVAALWSANPNASFEACVTQLQMGWSSQQCGPGFEAAPEHSSRLCTAVPAGELALLPLAYYALTTLLSIGAVIVLCCFSVPPLS